MAIDCCRFVLCSLLLCILGCGGESSRLIAELRETDSQNRRKAARALADPQFASDEHVVVALTTAASDADASVQEAAINSLGHFGAGAKTALSVLEQALTSEDSSVKLAAASAMARIDPASTAYQLVLIASLRDGNAPLFLEIGQMDMSAEWAVPTLIELLRDQRTHIRALAARTLGEIGIANDAVTSALQRRLQDTEPAVRRAAEAALGALQ